MTKLDDVEHVHGWDWLLARKAKTTQTNALHVTKEEDPWKEEDAGED